MRWPKGGWENYQQSQEWGKYETPRQVPSHQGPYFRGGGPDDRELKSGQGPSRTEIQKQTIPKKSGEPGSVYPHFRGKWLQEVEEEVHHRVGEAPQMIKGVMTQIRRKMRKRDTDEETESVTSSSQVSAHRGQPLIWGNDKRN